jgi:hypothetical protein
MGRGLGIANLSLNQLLVVWRLGGSPAGIIRRRLLVMPVAMMDIRIVRVGVGQFLVLMNVRVGFTGRIGRRVNMLMMLVVRVEMFMRYWFVAVRVGVTLSEMEPNTDKHQTASHPKKRRGLLVQYQQR